MDLTKLAPAPWAVTLTPAPMDSLQIARPDGYPMLLPADDDHPADLAALEFAALARNAFDIMLRRGWSALKSPASDKWRVDTDDGCYFAWGREEEEGVEPAEWPDPFSALVAADEWYRAHVEAKAGVAQEEGPPPP